MAKTPIQDVYDRIATKLSEKGVGQGDHVKAIASAAGIQLNAVYKWKNGESKHCSAFHISEICREHDLDMNWVMCGDAPAKSEQDLTDEDMVDQPVYEEKLSVQEAARLGNVSSLSSRREARAR